jgi:DNA-binding transcriptional regulator YdaS (Cro superfamily)
MEKTAKQELVRRCAELMGREQLAARLGISTTLLEAWIRGEVTMPNGQLLPLATSLNQLAAKKPDAATQRVVKDRQADC